ncbi:MAG: YceI family protein [Bacteroidetes bacterium]|nr:YceI family protein [Bacteroidota bacterium]
MKKMFILLVVFAVSSFAQTKWTFDKTHTQVKFTVTHLVITEVEGNFSSFDGSVETNGDNFDNAKINFTIDVASINTDNEKRDEHLKSDDFFSADKFAKITFVGKSLKKISDKKYKLVGDITIRDITKEIELDVKYNGIVNDPWGNTKAGFKLTGELDRFDFGLKWNALLEAGGAVVSKEVGLTINVELTKS